ncbi:hypothetical protein GCM10010358_05750 [Streptomyces minutiscleroticus]|uniref:Uncharacterized protein n=1 Tax=Streptomyces minutiscleroticus TaxID=68238 RepID=A0A918K8I0_9ACTN|nr:hypothetical protein GCM10010358_05750 [Streptomyces minutiscleroticus]
MGVAVDQPRQGDLAARVDALGGGEAGRGGGARHGLDAPAAYDDGGVLGESDVLLRVVHEDGAPGDDEVRGAPRGTGGRRRHHATVRRGRTGGWCECRIPAGRTERPPRSGGAAARRVADAARGQYGARPAPRVADTARDRRGTQPVRHAAPTRRTTDTARGRCGTQPTRRTTGATRGRHGTRPTRHAAGAARGADAAHDRHGAWPVRRMTDAAPGFTR